MSSLFRDLNHAAIDAKLNKNEFLIFNALMSQTLGFGKCSDPLTDKRIAELTGIRLDRLRPALKRFLKRNIFYRVEHHRYQYEYCIADHFFDDLLNKKIYTPHYAKSGESQQKPSDLTTNGGEKPVKRGHTTTNLTEIQKKPPQPNTEIDTEIKTEIKTIGTKKTPPQKINTDFQKKQPPQKTNAVIEIFLGGISELPEQFVIQSSEAVRIEFSSTLREPVATVETKTVATTATQTVATPVDIVREIAMEPKKLATAQQTAEPTIADEPPVIETTATAPIQSNNSNEKPVVVVEKKESEKKPPSVPKAVGESNQKACNNHFDRLSHQQKQDVLLVFYCMLKTGTIRNKANYFIGLCKSSKEDNLTLPTDVESNKKRSSKQIAEQKEDEKRRDLWSDYVCIQQFAKTEKVSEKTIAERLGMMEAYEVFGQETDVINQRLVA